MRMIITVIVGGSLRANAEVADARPSAMATSSRPGSNARLDHKVRLSSLHSTSIRPFPRQQQDHPVEGLPGSPSPMKWAESGERKSMTQVEADVGEGYQPQRQVGIADFSSAPWATVQQTSRPAPASGRKLASACGATENAFERVEQRLSRCSVRRPVCGRLQRNRL